MEKLFKVIFSIWEYSDSSEKTYIFSWNNQKEIWEKIKKEQANLNLTSYYAIKSEYGTIENPETPKEERMTPIFNVREVDFEKISKIY